MIIIWLKHALASPHTSFSAILLFFASVVGVLWPEYKAKADEIARLAIVYGLLNSLDTTRDRRLEALLAESNRRREEEEAAAKTSDPVGRIKPPGTP